MCQRDSVRVRGGLARVVRHDMQAGVRARLVGVGRHVRGDVQDDRLRGLAQEGKEGLAGLDEAEEVDLARGSDGLDVDVEGGLGLGVRSCGLPLTATVSC